jgi:hypothetical protein
MYVCMYVYVCVIEREREREKMCSIAELNWWLAHYECHCKIASNKEKGLPVTMPAGTNTTQSYTSTHS